MGNPQEGYVFRPPLWYNGNMINPIYIAGLIDGEGYLGLLPCKSMRLKNQSFEPVVKIGMTGRDSKELFLNLQSQYGGTVEQRGSLTKGNREAYTYVLKGKKRVWTLLYDIEEHLVIKQSQCKLLQEFCLLPMTHSLHKNFDESVLTRKIEIYSELKELKQPPATTK